MVEAQRQSPEFNVRINGSELDAAARADLLSVKVCEDLEVPNMFELQWLGWDTVQQQVRWLDDARFDVGNTVEIEMGYTDALAVVMVGEIAGLEPEFSSDRPPLFVVRGYDRSHRLMRGRYTRSFTQMKDSDIASQIAGDAGLTAAVEDTGVALDYVLQHNQTHLEFLQCRARRLGYEVGVEDKTLYFRPRQHAASEVLTLTRDDDLLEFYPRLSSLSQVEQVAVRGWDPLGKTEIAVQAGGAQVEGKMGGSNVGPAAVADAFGQSIATLVDRPVFSPEEAERMAVGQLQDMALGYISGSGVSLGRTDLRAGTTIAVDGIGDRFSGLYYLTSTLHAYTRRGYRTHFTVRRNAT